MTTTRKLRYSIAFILIGSASILHAQAFDPSTAVASPSTVLHGTDIEHVDLMSGALRVKIPLLHLKGRGMDMDIEATYSSKVWQTQYIPDAYDGSSIMVIENFASTSQNNGWNIGEPDFFSTGTGTLACAQPDPNCLGPMVYLGQIYKNDSSSISLSNATTYTNTVPISWPVWSYDGTYIKSSPDQSILYFNDGKQLRNDNVLEDTNGNQIQCSSSSCIDTVGRTVNFIGSPSVTSLSYTDSNGASQAISFAYQYRTIHYPSDQGDVPCGTPSNQTGSCVIDTYYGNLLTSITFPNGTQYTFEYADNGDGTTSGELSKMTYPTGGYVRYTYTNLDPVYSELIASNRRVQNRYVSPNGTSSGEQHWNYGPDPVVVNDSTISPGACGPVTDPAGNTHIEQFSVYSSQWFPGNCVSGPNPLDGQSFPPVSLVPVPTFSEDLDGAGALVQSTTKSYAFDSSDYNIFSPNAPVPASWGVTNPRVISETRVLGGSTNQAVTTYEYGNYGNVSTKSQYDWDGSLLNTVAYAYLADQNPAYAADNVHILNRPASEAVSGSCGSTSGVCATTSYIYDLYNSGRLASGLAGTSSTVQHDYQYYSSTNTLRGNVTQTISGSGVNGGSTTVDNAYDDLGNVTATMDGNGNTTTYDHTDNFYGPQPSQPTNAFVTKTIKPATNGVQHIEKSQYYLDSGLIGAHCGESFLSAGSCAVGLSGLQPDYVWMSYDSMNRPAGAHFGDGGSTTLSYSDVPLATNITQTKAIDSSHNIVTLSAYDGLGRQTQTQLQSDPSGVTYIDKTYDVLGRLQSVSNPYRSLNEQTYGNTSYAYDPIGRMRFQHQPDGVSTLQWLYAGNATTSVDEAGNSWIRYTDALGRLTNVVEPGSIPTSYGYDALGNLLTVTQNGVSGETPRIRSFGYDSLSRLTSASNPETGTISYNYDANSNLHQKTDARGIWTAYAYDSLNRLTDKYFNDGLTPNQHFRYDQTSVWMGPQSNTIGRLSQAYTDQDRRYYGSGSPPACNPQSSSTANYNPANGNPVYCEWTDQLYSYDAMGRQIRIGTAFPSEGGWAAHETDLTYDLAGNMASLTYPDGRVVTQAWDGAGRLQSSTFDNWNGQHVGYTYASGFTYTPSGAQVDIALGNGVSIHTPYNNRQQMCQVWSQTPSQPLIDTHIYYGGSTNYCSSTPGNNGNITQIKDWRNPNNTRNFGYDALNRIKTFSNGDNSMNQSYFYDSFGNMNQSGTLTFQGNYAASANNQINLTGYRYDAAGNLIGVNNGVPSTYSFDAESKMFNVNSGVGYYTFDAGGERMRKDSGGNFTEYQYLNGQPIAEKNSDGTWSDYIYANGQKIARADSFDARLHSHGTCGTSVCVVTWQIPAAGGHKIQSGDKLVWRQFQYGGGQGGLDVTFQDGTQTAWNLNDSTGQSANAMTTQNQWVSRSADLTNFINEIVQGYYLFTNNTTPPGTWDIYYSDIAIVGTDGTVTPIYNRQPGGALTLAYNDGNNATNLSAVQENSNQTGDSVQGYTTTTYYTGDQIGSTRMLTSAGGWPVSSDTFYPFGQEQNPTTDPNHYKFTGKERDTESGLDYFGARYYGSNMGRWMSPDWAEKPEAVPYSSLDNPQSLNLYGYVNNNPLSKADKDGHCAEDFCIVEGAATAYFAGAAVLAGTAAYLSTPSGQRSLNTFTSAAGASFSSSFHSLTNLFSKSNSSAPTPAAPTAGQAKPGDPATPATPAPAAPGTQPAQPRSNPMTGEPGSTSQTAQPDGSPKQVRRYGPDGHPETDVDHGHDHGQGDPHSHDWGRPPDGSPPTHTDRGPGRPVQPNDPKPQ